MGAVSSGRIAFWTGGLALFAVAVAAALVHPDAAYQLPSGLLTAPSRAASVLHRPPTPHQPRQSGASLPPAAPLAAADVAPTATAVGTHAHRGPVRAEALADVFDGPLTATAPSPSLLLVGAAMLGAVGFHMNLLRAERKQDDWAMASAAASLPTPGGDAAPSRTLRQRAVAFLSLLKPDFLLLAYLAVWYFGNYKSNISNKLALAEMGGAAGSLGCPLLVGSAEMFVGVLYALFLWSVPDARPLPRITWPDIQALLPLTVCTLGHQFATVYATSAGSLSSVQILKATEPVFAACFASLVYGVTVSQAKWLSLVPIIGGVSLASLKEVSFSWLACGATLTSNVFSAARSNESRKAMRTAGLKDRLGSVGNQFAVTTCLCFLMGLPISLIMEWRMLPTFCKALAANPNILAHIVSAGFWFYIYNEVSTLVVKRTGALTQSVLNTAKRVIVIVGASLVLGEGLAPLKLVGCAIGIAGVFLYSIADKIRKPDAPPPPPPDPLVLIE